MMETSLWIKLFIMFHMLKEHLVCTDKICQNFKFSIDQDLLADYTLEGHVFKSVTVDRVSECHVTCKDDCRCISMNFLQNIPRNNCQLNDVNKLMRPEALKYKPGTNYYDLVREYIIHGRRFYHGIDRCVNRCCQNNPCLEGGTCQEICEPTTVRFNCSCPPAYTGQRCEALKHPRNCKDIARNGAKISGRFRVFDSQDLPFIVYCDLTYEPAYVWTLIQSFSYGNNDQFKVNRFGLDLPVNEEESTINWSAYRLSLSRMRSLAVTSTHFRATCNFPEDGLVYTDYARAKLEGHDLFGKWFTQCRLFEYLNIRDIECYECTAGTWQYNEMWHVNSERSVSTAGCEFNGEAGAVPQEQNFGHYVYVNVNFRCTSGQNSTSQHWIGSRK